MRLWRPMRRPLPLALALAILLHGAAAQEPPSSTPSGSSSPSQSASPSPSTSPSAPPPPPGTLVISAFAGDGVARFAGTGALASLVRNMSFIVPGGIAYDDGTCLGAGPGSASLLVVADSGNARVRLINVTARSALVLTNGTSLPAPRDVVLGPGGSIFIADSSLQRVLMVSDGGGEFVATARAPHISLLAV